MSRWSAICFFLVSLQIMGGTSSLWKLGKTGINHKVWLQIIMSHQFLWAVYFRAHSIFRMLGILMWCDITRRALFITYILFLLILFPFVLQCINMIKNIYIYCAFVVCSPYLIYDYIPWIIQWNTLRMSSNFFLSSCLFRGLFAHRCFKM